jgi:uncharacterized membrane protein YbaN (DUF454 family)
MTRAVKRAAWLVGGWIFVLLGLAGLLVPLFPTTFLLLVGLVILSSEYVWAHQLLTKVRARFAKVSPATAAKADVWLDRIGGREGV